MELSIIILNYKTKGLVNESLKNLYEHQLPIRHEIFVVDNNSRDGCIEMVQKKFPRVFTIALPHNIGYAAGNNAALRKARGNFILILNPDVAVVKESIAALYDFMVNHPRAGIVGPKLINPDGSIQYSCFRWPTIATPIYRRTLLKHIPWIKRTLDNYLMKDFDHETPRKVPWVLGACMMIRKEFMDSVGMLDERFFLYYEDIDWCRQFWLKRYGVYYFPQAEMVHYYQRLSAEGWGLFSIFNKTARHHIASWIRYELKYAGKQPPEIATPD